MKKEILGFSEFQNFDRVTDTLSTWIDDFEEEQTPLQKKKDTFMSVKENKGRKRKIKDNRFYSFFSWTTVVTYGLIVLIWTCAFTIKFCFMDHNS